MSIRNDKNTMSLLFEGMACFMLFGFMDNLMINNTNIVGIPWRVPRLNCFVFV